MHAPDRFHTTRRALYNAPLETIIGLSLTTPTTTLAPGDSRVPEVHKGQMQKHISRSKTLICCCMCHPCMRNGCLRASIQSRDATTVKSVPTRLLQHVHSKSWSCAGMLSTRLVIVQSCAQYGPHSSSLFTFQCPQVNIWCKEQMQKYNCRHSSSSNALPAQSFLINQHVKTEQLSQL